MLYIIYICLYYVYRSELKLRSVRTAIYGASLLCIALVSLVSDRRSREMPVTGAGWGFSGHGWDEVGGRSSLLWQQGISDGERTTKVAPFATSIER